MGRKKIEIKFINDEKNRLVTFAKRKSGLFKKAYELSVLCECEIALLVFTRSNRLYQYASVTVEHALQRLKKHHRANEFLSNSDMERLTNRRMRSNCNGGSGVIPSQPYSNVKSEDNEDDGCVDEDDEDENDVEQPSIADIEKMNNNNGCDQICQPSDNDKQKFDQIDIQSNVRFVVEPQSTFGIHPRNSINTVTETHMRPVSSMSLPPNSLISSLNTVENEYLPHIQPVLVSHISSTTKPNSPSKSQLIHYPRSSHQPSLNSSSVSPFTCNNSVINSKALFTNLPKSTSHLPDHVNNILVSKQSSMPYIIQHSSNNQITLPVDCANLNDTHLVDDSTYMNTSLNHSFPHTTVMNSNTSENFSPTNNTGQMQCTLLTPTPYTQDLKVDQPIFILSSVVSNNHSNQNILNTNLTSSVNMEPEPVKLGPQDLPHLSNRHNYSDSCEQHGQMDDYRSGVYENLVNHFTTNPVTNMDKPIITVSTNSPLTTPVPPNKHYVISQQCMNSDYNLSSEPMVIIQKIDAPTQTTLPDIVDLDCLPSASIPSTLLCKTITVTKSEVSCINHVNHLNSTSTTNTTSSSNSNDNNDSNKNVTQNSCDELNMEEENSQQKEQKQSQNQSRQKRIPALKHLKLPSTCSSTVLRQTSIPNGYFLSTPEVINELGRLDGHRNNNNNNGNSSTDSPDTHHPLWHTFSPANIFYRLGLHQVLSLSPAPPTSREPPLFPLSHSPPTPTSIPSSSSLSNINAENQNSLITQPVLVSQSSCINMDTISAYCESESQNSPNVLPKYAKRSKYS
ncbi:hypothetical protein MS3_00002299 [Schistosoma haematobium]|uniref:MADS-box domain-containing protein n=1 Tax=Schistosoma haematobium TaxID=6185 RepID=A0A922LZR5_SCHHA|nr:hypothetical protein MS3_00002299 [Schistosoma haematobium]KAH9596709.1 hypothetical protein MS3_00002299 [Schistosoma haematobium]CAH8491367.1 unnamed protein product [Schistosoma haematobium]